MLQNSNAISNPEIDNIFCYIRLKKDLQELAHHAGQAKSKISIKTLTELVWVDDCFKMNLELITTVGIFQKITFKVHLYTLPYMFDC